MFLVIDVRKLYCPAEHQRPVPKRILLLNTYSRMSCAHSAVFKLGKHSTDTSKYALAYMNVNSISLHGLTKQAKPHNTQTLPFCKVKCILNLPSLSKIFVSSHNNKTSFLTFKSYCHLTEINID